LNGLRLVGLHAFEVVAPIRLSADYSHEQLLSLSSPVLWCVALGIVGTALLAAWLAWPRGGGRRRWPAGGFAALFFVLAAIGPAAAAAFPGGPIFAERDSYAASLAFPLAVAAALGAWFPARGRGLALAFLAVLAIAYGARTWARNRDWAEARTMGIQTARDAPRSARAHLWAAEAYFAPRRESGPEAPGGPEEARRKDDLRMATEEVQRSLEIEEGWRARAILGEILVEENRYVEAIAELEKAEILLARADPLRGEPSIRAARGEARLRAGKATEAMADLETSIRLYDLLGRRPRAGALSCRGLIRAQLGKLEDALRDFQRASEVGPELPQIWNDSGFCRFQLKDLDGAIADYQKGLEICRRKGILNAPSGDSAVAFLLRISGVHIERAKIHRAAGNEAMARADEERAAALRAEAAALAAPGKKP
jgi:tetratricopeptide (TPR) repeat protein